MVGAGHLTHVSAWLNAAQRSAVISPVPEMPVSFAECLANASVEFHRLRQRHPGIESAIGALQSSNGLKRCRDHTEIGFELLRQAGDTRRRQRTQQQHIGTRGNEACLERRFEHVS